MSSIEPITLSKFLQNRTAAKELCVIREDGWIVATFWIDHEDLFMRYLDNKIGSNPSCLYRKAPY